MVIKLSPFNIAANYSHKIWYSIDDLSPLNIEEEEEKWFPQNMTFKEQTEQNIAIFALHTTEDKKNGIFSFINIILHHFVTFSLDNFPVNFF